VFLGRNYTPVFSQNFLLLAGVSSQLSECPVWWIQGSCRTSTSIPPSLCFSRTQSHLYSQISQLSFVSRLFLSWFCGFALAVHVFTRSRNRWQLEFGVLWQDSERGAGSLGLLQSLYRAVFFTCTHWQTLPRLVLNEGSTSALDYYYTTLSARVDIKFQHL
jgi:hypothetical protein